MAAALAISSTCVTLDLGTTIADLLLGVGVLAIPVVAIPLVARVARRNPSQALRDSGRRRTGLWVFRAGLAITALGVLSLVGALIVGSFDSSQCERVGGIVSVVGALAALVGALLVGGGWAFASRAGWVVLATIAILDGWIFYILVLIDSEERVQGVLLLAFAIHAVCISVAARWSFTVRDLGPIEQAKAGEAGRALAAVWVFLASYSGLTLFRDETGISDVVASSAVTGALSLGALAVTMGSGFTKYSEAIHAKPRTRRDSTDGSGRPIAVEVWAVPVAGVVRLLEQEPDGLTVGRVRLGDGSTVLGVLAEPALVEGQRDITTYVGWRPYVRALGVDR